PSTLPYLSSIETKPKLNLTPPFSPQINQYFANVSYDQLLITIFAKTENCQSEVRIDDKFGPSRPINYTLGIGSNKVTFVVVDISHTEPWVISSYTLHINRLHPTHNESKFNPLVPHRICSLKQDCDLRVFARESCGLQKEVGNSWKAHLLSRMRLPKCSSGIAPGRWVLPCKSCEQKWTCWWREARWEPYACQHTTYSARTLSKCLENKKILFIGDSTNRGIMHYVIEKLNGSLTDNDKTHNVRLYNDLNHDRTLMGFTYYPKFWLPSNQRPAFDKTLLQLLERVQPLENESNIVIVFGGVQWLATQHIHMLLTTLSNLKLNRVKLIMKTLGAGFHQPIEGEEQQKLSSHNNGLSLYARMHGIETIDTYNITVARYKDYYPGKCACHFHLVTDVQPNPTQAFSLESSQPQRYHVEGSINAAYSEIFISRLCDTR
ncbi:cadherin-like and PC-esterase domain-containing protein 1, partial [Dinothrombium tinctorium]